MRIHPPTTRKLEYASYRYSSFFLYLLKNVVTSSRVAASNDGGRFVNARSSVHSNALLTRDSNDGWGSRQRNGDMILIEAAKSSASVFLCFFRLSLSRLSSSSRLVLLRMNARVARSLPSWSFESSMVTLIMVANKQRVSRALKS